MGENFKFSHKITLIVTILITKSEGIAQPWSVNTFDDDWGGRYFPYGPGEEVDNNPTTELGGNDLYDPDHGIMMGIKDAACDDGKTNLQIDWDLSPINYTCFDFDRRTDYKPRGDTPPLYSYDHIPKSYSATHKCMDQPIEYPVTIPTFGTHRPLWAKWGEYTFLPRQRWLHNLEHGGVVMLYHPCADKNEVSILKSLVRKCLYRHVITPFNLLTSDRPMALVAWGQRLEMSKVAPEIVIDFIKQHALKGPEQMARDGQYSLYLEKHADIISDLDDTQLCKTFDFIE